MIEAVCLACALLSRSQDPRPAYESLPGKLSFREVALPLDDLAKRLTEETKKPISVDSSIRDRKITLVCRPLPAGEVMRAVAETMFLEWRSEGDGFRLRMPPEQADKERRQLRLEQASAKTRIAEFLSRRARFKGVPFDEITRRWNEILGQLGTRGEGSGPTAAERAELRANLADLTPVDWTGFVSPLGSDSARLAERLVNGEKILLSTDDIDGAVKLNLAELPSAWFNGVRQSIGAYHAQLHWRQDTESLEMQRASNVGDSWHTSFTSVAALPGDAESKGPLDEQLADWGKALDSSVMGKRLDMAVRFTAEGYLTNASSLGEHLAHLAAVSETPVVGDAFRLGASLKGEAAGSTIAEYLRSFENPRTSNAIPAHIPVADFARIGAIRTERGWLMIRHAAYWRLNRVEVPERVIRPVEEKLRREGALTVEDYARLAGSLDDVQAEVVRERAVVLWKIPRYPIRAAVEFLRLWNTLTPSQRDKARGDGLTASTLSKGTLGRWNAALWERLFCGGSLPPQAARSVLAGRVDGSAVSLKLTDEPGDLPSMGDLEGLMPTNVTSALDADWATVKIDLRIGSDRGRAQFWRPIRLRAAAGG